MTTASGLGDSKSPAGPLLSASSSRLGITGALELVRCFGRDEIWLLDFGNGCLGRDWRKTAAELDAGSLSDAGEAASSETAESASPKTPWEASESESLLLVELEAPCMLKL